MSSMVNLKKEIRKYEQNKQGKEKTSAISSPRDN